MPDIRYGVLTITHFGLHKKVKRIKSHGIKTVSGFYHGRLDFHHNRLDLSHTKLNAASFELVPHRSAPGRAVKQFEAVRSDLGDMI